MPFWLDIGDDEEIAPVTLSHALNSGWLWKIPTQKRYGCGYVYSDAHLTPEQAKSRSRGAARPPHRGAQRHQAERRPLDKAWIGNCLALGLASSFLEPLEATSIHGTVVQLLLFAGPLSQRGASTPAERDDYNARVARQIDDFRSFINAHYCGGRSDTPFWRDFAATSRASGHARAPRSLAARRCRGASISRPSSTACRMSKPSSTIPCLTGCSLLDRRVAQAEMEKAPALRDFARKTYDDLRREYSIAAGKAMGHAAFLKHAREKSRLILSQIELHGSRGLM